MRRVLCVCRLSTKWRTKWPRIGYVVAPVAEAVQRAKYVLVAGADPMVVCRAVAMQSDLHRRWGEGGVPAHEQLAFMKRVHDARGVTSAVTEMYRAKKAELENQMPLYTLTTHREVLQFRRTHLRRMLKVRAVCRGPSCYAVANVCGCSYLPVVAGSVE